MHVILDWISGMSWTLVYALAMYHGIRKETYCIPAVCICFNFSWEMWTVLVRVCNRSALDSGFISQLLWLVLDVGVLYTWFRYASGISWKKKMTLLLGAAVIMAGATLCAGFWEESAFVINLIMSVAFLFRVDRQIFRSLPIALLKCLGTLPAAILNGILYRNFFVLAIGGLCLFADLLYIYEILKDHKTEINERV